MKLLLLPYHENISDEGKTTTHKPHPHLFTQKHLDRIKETAPDIDIAVVTRQEEVIRHLPDADIIAGFPSLIPPLEGAKNIKWVHSFSAGVDRALTPEIKNSPILVSNSSGIHRTPIAEHVIGFMLIFTRGFYRTFKNQVGHSWAKAETLGEIRDKTVLVVGMGEIGGEVARLAHAFGARVIATVRTKQEKPEYVDVLDLGDTLDDLLPEADFVAICLPYTGDTHHLFEKNKFERMKRSAVIINIGRGGIINEADLIEALKNGVIGGAALDVTEKEPLPADSPLWDMENVVITPHHSGLSEKYMDRAIDLFCRNLAAFVRGETLLTLVDKERGY